MFASSGMMLAGTALDRIRQVIEAPTLKKPDHPQMPQNNKDKLLNVNK